MACMSVRLWRLCRRSSTQRRVSKKERMTCVNPLRCLLSQLKLKLFCPKLLVHDTLSSTILDCSFCYSSSNLIICYICLSVHDHHPTSPVQELRSRWWPGEVVIARDKWPGSNQLSLASLNAATTSKPVLCRHSFSQALTHQSWQFSGTKGKEKNIVSIKILWIIYIYHCLILLCGFGNSTW